jgi:hypothetical protein
MKTKLLIGFLAMLVVMPNANACYGIFCSLVGDDYGLSGLVGSYNGWPGYDNSYERQLHFFYNSLPQGSICSYGNCNTNAAIGGTDSRSLFSSLVGSLFMRLW